MKTLVAAYFNSLTFMCLETYTLMVISLIIKSYLYKVRFPFMTLHRRGAMIENSRNANMQISTIITGAAIISIRRKRGLSCISILLIADCTPAKTEPISGRGKTWKAKIKNTLSVNMTGISIEKLILMYEAMLNNDHIPNIINTLHANK